MEGSIVISRSQWTFWRMNNQQKPSGKMVQEVQIGRYKPRRWRRKRSTIKFQRPDFWHPWKRTKSWQRECWPKTLMWTFRLSFVVSKSSEKYGNWMYGSPTNSPTTTKPNVSEFTPICCRETSKLRFWRISSLAMNRGFSSKISKERRFEFRQVFHRKASTVRRQCDVIAKKFVEIAKWLCCIPSFLVVAQNNMTNMNMIFDTHFLKEIEKFIFIKKNNQQQQLSLTKNVSI